MSIELVIHERDGQLSRSRQVDLDRFGRARAARVGHCSPRERPDHPRGHA